MDTTDESYEVFFRENFARLVAFVMTLGFDYEASSDAAAEAMASAFVSWAEISHPPAWVRVAAARHARRSAKRLVDGLRRAASHGWLAEPLQESTTPIIKEEQRLLIDLLRQLSSRRRMVMALHIDGFSTLEIAEHLEITPETARSHLRHAREHLRQQVSARGIGVPTQEGDCDD